MEAIKPRSEIDDLVNAETYRYCERREINQSMVESARVAIRHRMCLEEMQPFTDMKQRLILSFVERSIQPMSGVMETLPESAKEAIALLDAQLLDIRKKYYPTVNATE